MISNISIEETELDEVFKTIRKKKLIVARPSNISVLKEENHWMISLSFDSSAYQKSSSYMSLKPVWNFIKEKIREIDPSSLICWKIIRT